MSKISGTFEPNNRELNVWFRRNSEEAQARAIESRLWYSAFAVHESHEVYAIVLASFRNDGGSVVGATRVTLALLRDGRGRTSFYGDKGEITLVREKEMDDAAWMASLETACTTLGVNPDLLQQLAKSTKPKPNSTYPKRRKKRDEDPATSP